MRTGGTKNVTGTKKKTKHAFDLQKRRVRRLLGKFPRVRYSLEEPNVSERKGIYLLFPDWKKRRKLPKGRPAGAPENEKALGWGSN